MQFHADDNHHNDDSMNIALHSMAFMFTNPYLDDAIRDELQDAITMMVEFKAQANDPNHEWLDEDAIGNLDWYADDDESDWTPEDEFAYRLQQKALASRWN